MTTAAAFIWAALCAPIAIFWFFDADPQLRFNYSLIAQIAGPVAAGLVCYYASLILPREDSMRKALVFLGMGMFSWGIGAVLFALYPLFNNGQETPYPWYSDIGYLLLYPFVLVSFFIFKQNFPVRVPLMGKASASIFFLIALALSIHFNLNKLGESDTVLTYGITLLYTIGDPLLLGSTVVMASILFGGLAARPWWLILVGLILFYLADLLYTYFVLEGQYATGNPLDIGWALGSGFIAVAALMIRSLYEEL